MNKCKHLKTTFFGFASIKGNYVCDDCGFEIDPVIEAWRKDYRHILFSQDRKEDLQKYLAKLPQEQLNLMNN